MKSRNKKSDQEIVVLVTAASEEQAEKIGRRVVEEGVAACANIVPRIRSIFFWDGKVCGEQECLLLVKTRSRLFEDLATTVRSVHSYTVPEIIALPIVHGSKDYLAWIHEVTRRARAKPLETHKKQKSKKD